MALRLRRNYTKLFSQTTHTYTKEGTPVGLLLGGGVRQGVLNASGNTSGIAGDGCSFLKPSRMVIVWWTSYTT